MGGRAPRPVVRKPLAPVVRVAGLVDGFLEVAEEPRARAGAEKRPVREKVERKLRRLHPMD
ncbi:MAG TPA: hypothetical protein VND93_03195 [Myxococcales bacterium]|nr:hypothetical protein [Myxococcales bacterium]